MSLTRQPMPPRREPFRRDGGLARTGGPERRTGLAPVSATRRAETRVRRAMAAGMFPEPPLCAVYELWQHQPDLIPDGVIGQCRRWADDLHEPLSRGRGGKITDPANGVGLCRPCHDVVTFRPESELGWAYDLGLLRHSWTGGLTEGEVA